MTDIHRGIAHVSFPGGGVFLPTRSPYDRQTLTELVTDRARTKGRVQVLVDDQRWTVYCDARPCVRCGVAAGVACYSPRNRQTGYCVHCALVEASGLRSSFPSLEPAHG